MDEALACFDEAIPLLRQAGEFVVLARTLLNRAMLHQYAGRVRLALADLDQCEQISAGQAGQADLARIFAKAAHGRGQARVLTGDIPGALRAFDAAGADFAAGRRIARVAAEATALAGRLTELGLRNDAEIAALLAARARIALGDLDGARTGITPRDRRAAPLENRLVRRLALAELGAASGNRRITFDNARAGLTQLERHRGRFGSID